MKLLWFLQCLFFLALLLIHPSIAPRAPAPPSGRNKDNPVKSPPPPSSDHGTHP
ncbi:hypothetical protein SESBI_20598 [Sesbania bispinosa]|nr:hypothetical protein SESBI_20598 [Sesbania bispinosa]